MNPYDFKDGTLLVVNVSGELSQKEIMLIVRRCGATLHSIVVSNSSAILLHVSDGWLKHAHKRQYFDTRID